MEEEKKESLGPDEEKEARPSASLVRREYPVDSDSDGDDDPDLHGLPSELRGLRDKTFEFEDELHSLVVSRGFGDLDIILDPKTKKARFRMTSGAHDEVTGVYTNAFNEDWRGIAAAHDGTCNIFIQPLPGRAITRRKPDIAFWGPAKCETIVRAGRARTTVKHLKVPPKIHSVTREQIEKVNPDVIFQFSWGNGEGYEVKAIDEMMNRALVTYSHNQPNNEAPTLGFLVKIRTANKRNAIGQKIIRCIDVYRLPHGTTFEDAKASQNGASHHRFFPGQPDVVVEITPQDLRITHNATMSPPRQPFQISAAEIYEMLQT